MFASCSAPEAEPATLGMKVEKAHQAALVATDRRYSVAAYVGQHGWINVDTSGDLDWDEVRELVIESYVLNGPRRLARAVADAR
jgi:predicted DNA-binding protein (MmcQ/YjbR family)